MQLFLWKVNVWAIFVLLLIPLSLLLAPLSFAEIIEVPGNFEAIQRAINHSEDGDTVLVSPGTYRENILYSGKNIVVGSLMLTTGNEAYIDSTIIDGNEHGSVVAFFQRVTSDAKLIGFTIQNGRGWALNQQFMGGGILIVQSDVVIKHCKIRNNQLTNDIGTWGGGIGFYGLGEFNSPTIRDCEIYMNSSLGYGGGLGIIRCNPTLERVIIRDNSAEYGAGICIDDDCNVTLNNCAISGNNAESIGGGIIADTNSSIILRNANVVGNSCNRYAGGILLNGGVQIIALNSIIWDNYQDGIFFSPGNGLNYITISFCDVESGEEGIITNNNGEVNWHEGNVDSDPLFIDAEGGDLHLTENSPCIDAGTAFFVWEEDTLINMSDDEYQGFSPDMGLFESPYENSIDGYECTPQTFVLHPAYPNPFNSTTTIEYVLPVAAEVSLSLYSLSGQRIRTLVNGRMKAGAHKTMLDAGDLVSGLYFVKFVGSGQLFNRKIMLIK